MSLTVLLDAEHVDEALRVGLFVMEETVQVFLVVDVPGELCITIIRGVLASQTIIEGDLGEFLAHCLLEVGHVRQI